MKKNFLKALQTLLVFSLAFTLTSCWNFDNPLEEMGGSGSGSGSGGGGGSSDSDSTPTLTMEQTPLTFEAAEANAKVTFTIKVATDPVEYSRDGKTWSPYTSAEAIELCKQFGCFSQCYTVIEHNLIAEVGQILRWQKFRRY